MFEAVLARSFNLVGDLLPAKQVFATIRAEHLAEHVGRPTSCVGLLYLKNVTALFTASRNFIGRRSAV